MDKGKFQKLNAYHVIFLVQNVLVGLGLLSLPQKLSGLGYDQWWMPIFMGIGVQIALLPIIWLGLKFPQDTVFEIHEKLLGKWLGRVFNILLIFYGLMQVAAVSEGYLRLMQVISLPEYTIGFPLVILFVLMVYTVLGGIKSVARLCILSVFLTGWMLYYLQWPFQKGNLGHIFPLFHLDFTLSDFMYASKQGFGSMLGFELLLVFFPYIIHQKQALKHATIGLWITVLFYTLVCLASIAYFSPWQLEHLLYPVLNLFKAVELSFIERIENLGLGLWIFLILSTTSAYLWMAKRGMDALLSHNRTWHLYLCAVLVFAFMQGPIPYKFRQVIYEDVTIYIGFGWMVWPSILLMINRLRYLRRNPS